MAQSAPLGGTPPRLEPKVSDLGSQRAPLLTFMSASGGADAHKRRLEYRLMVRRRDP